VPQSQCDSDVKSIQSNRSRNTITYNRPFTLKHNPTLTDLRSLRNTLSSASSNDSSSIQRGIGYYSGKGIYWVGKKMLDVVMPLEICRRVWMMKRFVKSVEQCSLEDRFKESLWKQKKIDRILDDILELSS
jgi:hypothetical protein